MSNPQLKEILGKSGVPPSVKKFIEIQYPKEQILNSLKAMDKTPEAAWHRWQMLKKMSPE